MTILQLKDMARQLAILGYDAKTIARDLDCHRLTARAAVFAARRERAAKSLKAD